MTSFYLRKGLGFYCKCNHKYSAWYIHIYTTVSVFRAKYLKIYLVSTLSSRVRERFILPIFKWFCIKKTWLSSRTKIQIHKQKHEELHEANIRHQSTNARMEIIRQDMKIIITKILILILILVYKGMRTFL